MGCPISPLFADIVMDDLEKTCLQTLKNNYNCVPLFYYRSVDDTIMCIKREHIDLVVSIFNSYHKSLQFTYEMEKNNSISFLGMTLINKNNRISTNWYQKPTFSIRVINFFFQNIQSSKKEISSMRRFTSTVPARVYVTHVYDTKMYLKKLFDKRFRRIFSSSF